MIGYLEGSIVHSNEREIILLTKSGVGYQIFVKENLTQDDSIRLFICTIQRETSTELFGFTTYQEKKFFELLLTVKGVGPKSAFALISHVGIDMICNAIVSEEKSILKEAPGIGNKVAAQLILDLREKIPTFMNEFIKSNKISPIENWPYILSEAIMACKELGLPENKVAALANKLVKIHAPKETSELVQLILRETRS